MAAERTPLRVVAFAAAVCIVCSVLVSGAAVLLGPRQEANRTADRQHKILVVADLAGRAPMEPAEVSALFREHVRPRVVEVPSGRFVDAEEATTTSHPAPPNQAGVREIPDQAVVYEVMDGDRVRMIVLPVEGMGLWSTLRGYLAVDPDGTTIRGLNYYEHAETPGLGAEVDNPEWQQRWEGRRIYGPDGAVQIEVVKGAAGPPAEDPHRVDGITGATITADGVTHMMHLWLGPDAFGPLLAAMRRGGTT